MVPLSLPKISDYVLFISAIQFILEERLLIIAVIRAKQSRETNTIPFVNNNFHLMVLSS